jgi:hypothetical protein
LQGAFSCGNIIQQLMASDLLVACLTSESVPQRQGKGDDLLVEKSVAEESRQSPRWRHLYLIAIYSQLFILHKSRQAMLKVEAL